MELSYVITIGFYVIPILIRVASRHDYSLWTVIRLTILGLHRSVVVYFTLVEVNNWHTGHPTSLVKDWIQEDMGYVIYLPMLGLEMVESLVRIFRDIRSGRFSPPSVTQCVARSVPDIVVFGAIGYLATTILNSR